MSWHSNFLCLNRWRGEVFGCINGKKRIVRLNLDAIARLEQMLPDADIISFLRRIAVSGIGAQDTLCVIRAGLIGAKDELAFKDEALDVRGGFTAAVMLATELLSAAFEQPMEIKSQSSDEPSLD